MANVLIPVPSSDFDPTEVAIPWKILRFAGYSPIFATPSGAEGQADPRMLTGVGLGVLAPLLSADARARQAYRDMERSHEFQNPIAYAGIRTENFQGLLLPGGHAPGMKPYLESEVLQSKVIEFFQQGKPVGAICHGVLLAARSRVGPGRSVLFGRKTTGLTKLMELSAWSLTCAWLGNYYRTYRKTVEDEVKEALANPHDFLRGPMALTRDNPGNLEAGFTVLDGRYLSARWPGDAHRFGTEFARLLQSRSS
jgi:putative intracellular protease/amidase